LKIMRINIRSPSLEIIHAFFLKNLTISDAPGYCLDSRISWLADQSTKEWETMKKGTLLQIIQCMPQQMRVADEMSAPRAMIAAIIKGRNDNFRSIKTSALASGSLSGEKKTLYTNRYTQKLKRFKYLKMS